MAAASVNLTQGAIETLSQPILPAARLSQAVVEVLGGTVSVAPTEARVSQTLVEVVTLTPIVLTEVRVTQDALELLVLSPPLATRATQLAAEVFTTQGAVTRTTHVALEVLFPIVIPTRVTQVAAELYRVDPAPTRMTQEVVELFIREQPRRLIRRLRRAPHVHDEHRRIAYAKFALDLQRGVGALMGQGANPVVTLRVSRDGGRTWSEPVQMRAGTLGAYTTRVLARRLGQARDAVFEVTVSDPVAWSLVQAWLDLEPGTS